VKILLLLIGLGSYFFIGAAAQIYPVELLVAGMVVPLAPAILRRLRQDRILRTTLFVGGLWLASQIATDIVRQTARADAARGILGILFLLACTATLSIVTANRQARWYALLLGTQVSCVLNTTFSAELQALGNGWKWGYGLALSFAFLLVAGKHFTKGRAQATFIALAVLGLALFTLLMNARSLGGAIAVTGFLLLAKAQFPRTFARLPAMLRRPARAIPVILLGAAGITVLAFGIVEAGRTGLFGKEASQKWSEQSQGRYGVLLAGRGEIIFSADAISDSPILGHGSWAKNPKYRDNYWLLYDWGYFETEGKVQQNIEHKDLIPTHSHIFGAWVWAGVAGFAFWGFVVGLLLRLVVMCLSQNHPLGPYVLFACVTGVWSIFFSPFGGISRIQWEILLPFLIYMHGVYASGERRAVRAPLPALRLGVRA
jgi:hypothetical protein